MKPVKKSFTAILTLVITGTILTFGCPGFESDPRVEYPIHIDPEIDSTCGDITVNRWFAAEGETVKITVEPKSDFVARNVRVRDVLNHSVNIINISSHTINTWEFKMPSVSVTIFAEFVDLRAGLNSAISTLSAASSWDEIAEGNVFLAQFQELLGTQASVDPDVRAAIKKLAGYGKDIGIIRNKMRAETNFWILPANNLPSYSIDAGGEDRTHLYYVSAGLNPLPPIALGNGWTEGTRQQNYTASPVGASGNVTLVPLTYKVGLDDSDLVTYNLLLWPVAQFTLVYADESLNGEKVTITEFSATKISATETHLGERNRSIPDISSTSLMQNTSYVNVTGKNAIPLTAPYVVLEVKALNEKHLITVKESNGTVVQRICVGDTLQEKGKGCGGAHCGENPGSGCGHLDGSDYKGFFLPQSRNYTITLSLPPTP